MSSGLPRISFWGYKFNSYYIFTQLGTFCTRCPVPLRYSAWKFWGYESLYTPFGMPVAVSQKHGTVLLPCWPIFKSLLLWHPAVSLNTLNMLLHYLVKYLAPFFTWWLMAKFSAALCIFAWLIHSSLHPNECYVEAAVYKMIFAYTVSAVRAVVFTLLTACRDSLNFSWLFYGRPM